MNYEDMISNQVDRIRQVRNDDFENYPRTLETLWILIRNNDVRGLIEEKKKELGIEPSNILKKFDMNQWDIIFQYTLDLFSKYEGIYL